MPVLPVLSVRRRSLLHAAWAAPAITIATAAPAFAGSQDPWTVSSDSWEGLSGGVRTSASTDRYFQLSIQVPGGAIVVRPQVQVTFALSGNGGGLHEAPLLAVVGTVSDGNGGVWDFVGTDGLLAEQRTWVFTHADVTGPVTLQLHIGFSLVSDLDVDASSLVVVSSGSSTTGPTITYRQRDDNAPTATGATSQILQRL